MENAPSNAYFCSTGDMEIYNDAGVTLKGCIAAEGAYTHDYSLSIAPGDVGIGISPCYQWTPSYIASTPYSHWECPYCGADHELTAKICDCCGARRRQEYVY